MVCDERHQAGGRRCALALATASLSACGNDGTQVTARFVSAAPLVEGNQVKIDGIVVGTIEGLRVRDGLAEVTMNLDPEAMPLHDDATFTIRPASLLGERYVDLDRGTASAPTLDASRVVPVSRTGVNVGLDDMLNTLDDPAGEGLAMLVNTLGNGVNGNGENVDQTITGLAPNMKEIQALTAVLKNHNELLGSLVEDAEPIVGALADQEGQTLDQLVAASDSVLGVTADNQDDLERTLKELPGTLKVGRKTLAALSDTADEAAPTLDALEPFTEDLPEISEELEDFADALDPALSSSRPLLDRADELLIEARRPADDLAHRRARGGRDRRGRQDTRPWPDRQPRQGLQLHPELGVERQRIRRRLALLANRHHRASRLVDVPVADAHRHGLPGLPIGAAPAGEEAAAKAGEDRRRRGGARGGQRRGQAADRPDRQGPRRRTPSAEQGS